MCCVGGFIMLLKFFFFKQKTAYEMRISDWSSDVCSSDLQCRPDVGTQALDRELVVVVGLDGFGPATVEHGRIGVGAEAEEAAHRPQAQDRQGDRKSVV